MKKVASIKQILPSRGDLAKQKEKYTASEIHSKFKQLTKEEKQKRSAKAIEQMALEDGKFFNGKKIPFATGSSFSQILASPHHDNVFIAVKSGVSALHALSRYRVSHFEFEQEEHQRGSQSLGKRSAARSMLQDSPEGVQQHELV